VEVVVDDAGEMLQQNRTLSLPKAAQLPVSYTNSLTGRENGTCMDAQECSGALPTRTSTSFGFSCSNDPALRLRLRCRPLASSARVWACLRVYTNATISINTAKKLISSPSARELRPSPPPLVPSSSGGGVDMREEQQHLRRSQNDKKKRCTDDERLISRMHMLKSTYHVCPSRHHSNETRTNRPPTSFPQCT
jgi:hypothetical protein